MKADVMTVPLFDMYMTEKKKLEPLTRNEYLIAVKKFLSTSPDIEDPEEYIKFLVRHAVQRRSYHYTGAIKHFLDFIIDDNKLRTEIWAQIKERKIRPQDPIRYMDKQPLNEEELNKVINGIKKEKHRIMTYIMYETGVRVGDVLRIPRNGIKYDKLEGEDTLKLEMMTKGGKVRSVWVFKKEVADIIYRYSQTLAVVSDYLFIEPKQRVITHLHDSDDHLRRLNYRMYYEDLKESLSDNGIDRKRFAPHSIRRIYARRVWEKWHDIDILKRLMGHSDAATSMIYLRQDGLNVANSMKEIQLD